MFTPFLKILEQFFLTQCHLLTQKHYFVLTDVCSLGLEDSFPRSKPGPAPRLTPQWEAGPPSEVAYRLLQLTCASSSVPVFCLQRKTACQGQWVEWKYLYLQEQWEWGKNKQGKSSRDSQGKTRTKEGGERETCGPRANRWRKHLSFRGPSLR